MGASLLALAKSILNAWLHIDKYTCDYFIMGKISAVSSFLGSIDMEVVEPR